MKCIVLLFCIFSASFNAVSQEMPSEKASDAIALVGNYHLSVRADKKTYHVGEDVQLIELLMNRGPTSRVVNYDPQWYRCIVRRGGKIVNFVPANNPAYSKKLALLSASRFTRRIEGGKGVKGSYSINEIADIGQPGHYTIEARRTFPDKMGEPDPKKIDELTAKTEFEIIPGAK